RVCQKQGEKIGDQRVVGRSYLRQAACLFHLDQPAVARELVATAIDVCNTTDELFREACIDTLASAREADYLQALYRTGFLKDNLSAIDQWSVYTFICCHNIIAARQ